MRDKHKVAAYFCSRMPKVILLSLLALSLSSCYLTRTYDYIAPSAQELRGQQVNRIETYSQRLVFAPPNARTTIVGDSLLVVNSGSQWSESIRIDSIALATGTKQELNWLATGCLGTIGLLLILILGGTAVAEF